LIGWTQFCPFEDLDFPEDAWDKCFAVNIKAHVWLLKAALPTFKKNDEGGHLLITGSIAVTPYKDKVDFRVLSSAVVLWYSVFIFGGDGRRML